MPNKIETSLTNLFEHHRIVFWYDSKKELREDYDSIDIDDVNKVEINNNELTLKYQMLREKPTEKFLLYREDDEPVNPVDNWLLDVQLAHYVFSDDQVTIWAQELGLGTQFHDLIRSHSEFFQSESRRTKLQTLLGKNNTKSEVNLKMLSVCASSVEESLDPIIENLLQELSKKKNGKIKLIKRCNLDELLFEKIRQRFNYQSNEPSIKDFYVELFKSYYAGKIGGEISLSDQGELFVNRWKDSRNLEESFKKLSNDYANKFGIERDLDNRDYADLIDIDIFDLIDKRIITGLVHDVVNKNISAGEVSKNIHRRSNKHYFEKYRDIYEAINYAAQFFSKLDNTVLEMKSFIDGITIYSEVWYEIDQLYRKFLFHIKKSQNQSLMTNLIDLVEDFYSNKYLLKLNNKWQFQVDNVDLWGAPPITLQRNFFKDFVKPFLDDNKKICVIISDAMRYEIGQELVTLIRRENRYTANIDPALSMLPSYTQLGMAALLPNQELTIVNDDTSTVQVDGKSSQGIKNREKILKNEVDKEGSCIQANKWLDMDNDKKRALSKNNNLLYIYHNLIDLTGDKRDTEGRVFKAADDTLEEIISIIKTIARANFSHILITSDHGFIYQNQELDESDFSSVKVEAEKTFFSNRRFVLGKGFKENHSFKTFKSSELGLMGDVEIAIPNSITRFRQRGAGSRFVHGGASLQEVVIPVISIHKGRVSDISKVEIEVIKHPTKFTITTSQLTIVLYQKDPVSEKNQPRVLRLGIYTKDNKLISDSHEYPFDFSSDNPRDREIEVQLILIREANQISNQDVELRLEEKEPGTTQYKPYNSYNYSLKRSFTTDFDL
jgi:uncharacterized protein (TIGR02687 family)